MDNTSSSSTAAAAPSCSIESNNSESLPAEFQVWEPNSFNVMLHPDLNTDALVNVDLKQWFKTGKIKNLPMERDNKLWFPANQNLKSIVQHLNQNVCHDCTLVTGRVNSNSKKDGKVAYIQCKRSLARCSYKSKGNGESRSKRPKTKEERCKFQLVIHYNNENDRWLVRQHCGFCWQHTAHSRDEEKLAKSQMDPIARYMEKYREVCGLVDVVDETVDDIFTRNFENMRAELSESRRGWLPSVEET
eukprot:scaffold55311_cov60-Cyclotella_meneghiniana.AAC.1